MPGYAGDHCGTDINECESNPCVNGECIDMGGGYECNCTGTGTFQVHVHPVLQIRLSQDFFK